MPQPAPLQVVAEKKNVPAFVLTTRERQAYRAAHRIMAENMGDERLPRSSGAYQRTVVDDIARIIVEEFGGVWKP